MSLEGMSVDSEPLASKIDKVEKKLITNNTHQNYGSGKLTISPPTIDDAIKRLYTHIHSVEQTPQQDIKKELQEALEKKDYVAAVGVLFHVLFMGGGDKILAFKTFQERGYSPLDKKELKRIGESVESLSQCKEYIQLMNELQKETSINKKIGLTALMTQIKDVFTAKKIANKQKKSVEKCSDVELFEGQLKVGSILCMQQERKNASLTMKIGDIGMMTQDTKQIIDMTHSAVVVKIDPVVIRHATMKEGVHDVSLSTYLQGFDRVNMCCLEPTDDTISKALLDTTQKDLGKKYDYGAPFAQYLASIDIPGKSLFAKDDPTKTNCVEYIADALYNTDKTHYKKLYEKSHPNDLLVLAEKGSAFQLSYAKTLVMKT